MIYHGQECTLDDLGEAIEQTTEAVRERAERFDSIVVRGVSGLLVGPAVAVALEKPLIVARKVTEYTHDSALLVNSHRTGARALFLDDFRSSGETERQVAALLEERSTARIELCFFYRTKWGRTVQDGWTDPFVAEPLTAAEAREVRAMMSPAAQMLAYTPTPVFSGLIGATS